MELKDKNLPFEALSFWESYQETSSVCDFWDFLDIGGFIGDDGAIILDQWNSYIKEVPQWAVRNLFNRFARSFGLQAIELFYQLLPPEMLEKKADEIRAQNDAAAKEQKNITWESNHRKIFSCITDKLDNYLNVPSVTTIERETGLSRPTIYKHLAELKTNEYYRQKAAVLRIGLDSIATQLYRQAIRGDIRAARLYFEIVKLSSRPPKQTNYIQVNNTKIDINQLEQLPPAAAAEIETIISKSLPPPPPMDQSEPPPPMDQ